jgi:phage gp29-like protein
MLYDAQGKVLPAAEATRPAAGVAVRFAPEDRYEGDVSRGLTPQRVDGILAAANSGDTEQQCRLAVELEEKNWDAQQALATRRAAVAGLPWEIEPPEGLEEDAAAQDAADALKEALDAAGGDELLDFAGLLRQSLLSALVPGFACAEVVWSSQSPVGARKRTLGLAGFQHVPAAAFTFPDGARRPRLVTRETPRGMLLPPAKFIVHLAAGPSGDPARGGLIRPLAWLHCFQNLNVKDLLGFIERFGMPFLLARVDASAYDTERSRLVALVRSFGSAGGGVFTKAVEAQMLQASQTTADVYFKLLEYTGAAITKVVLGQTATSGEASGWSNGGAQAAVRQDLLEADCAALAATLRRQLFAPWTQFNLGPPAPVPRIVFRCEPPEDRKGLADTLAALAGAGLEAADPDEVAAKVGVKLQRRPAPAPAPGYGPLALRGEAARQGAVALAADGLPERLAAALGVPSAWLGPVDSLLRELEAKAADQAVSDAELLAFGEEAAARLPELFAEMDVDALAELLERAMGAAVLDGARAGLRRAAAAARPQTAGSA